MRMVIQRVLSCALKADGVPVDSMGQGLLVLVGIQPGDEEEAVMRYMLDKLVHLRIFEDENGKMNLSVEDLGLDLFLVSNFTLYGDCRHGRRPSYSSGASPEEARTIYDAFVSYMKANTKVPVHTGVFQAYMDIETRLDGPVTLLLDSQKDF
ncbi:MAG: D-tyrosyl-tRNA(Tyr) deacylase [Lachnospiraceae bacterium]|nr:D-tyrosyl-tRNA(Tyr) deacylase [Lachnospiraceae bacterium]